MMLSPDDRILFLQALRPPEGYTFDRGIGTTYTLDLYTLLITPLSLALFDFGSKHDALADPFSLLISLQKYASRLTVFCQSGGIKLPVDQNPLISFLEKMVIEVKSPRNGIFHPKVWLLRYTKPENPPLYRLLNLSRNLTFDRSWDLIMRMDGCVADRKLGFGMNRPLGDFLKALPSLAVNSVPDETKAMLKVLEEEINRVKFEAPPEFDREFVFHPIGIPGYRNQIFKSPIWRMLVISPFLTNDLMESVSREGEGHWLISRFESIDSLKETVLSRFEKIYVMDERAEDDPQEIKGVENEMEDQSKEAMGIELSGLHAKLFVWENHRDAHWLIGSANGTDAAFRNNVEFMIELRGRKSCVGINKILVNEKEQDSLLRFLVEYKVQEKRKPVDRDIRHVEELTNAIQNYLINLLCTLEVAKEGDIFNLIMRASQTIIPPEGQYTVDCWPISQKEDTSQSFKFIDPLTGVVFKNISLVGLTAFIGFSVNAIWGKAKLTNKFVLLLPITGLPLERETAILTSILSNGSQFLRFLRLILMEDDEIASSSGLLRNVIKGESPVAGWIDQDMPLLEQLMRALSRSNNPGGKVDQIAQLIERLNRTEEGQAVIPQEFKMVWEKILQARQEIL